MSDHFIHPSAVVDEGAQIGPGTKVWHFSHVMSNARVGEGCILGQNVFVGNSVRIGDRVKVQNNVSLYEGVLIEDEVFVGPSVVFTNVINPRSVVERKSEFRQTIVRKGVSIGANATIICGIELGQYCFIGAGAVVTHPVKQYALVLGNPAVPVGWMSEMGHRLSFDESGTAICPGDQSVYVLKDGNVKKR